MSLEIGEGLPEPGGLEVVRDAEVPPDERVQAGVGGALVPDGLFILGHGGEYQLVLAAVVNEGMIPEERIFQSGGLFHAAKALHQDEAVPALFEAVGKLRSSGILFGALQQQPGGIIDGKSFFGDVQVHGHGLQVEPRPDGAAGFPEFLQLPERAAVMGERLLRLSVSEIVLAETELRDGGAQGTSLCPG